MDHYDQTRLSTRDRAPALRLAGHVVPARDLEDDAPPVRPARPHGETFYERKRAAVATFEREYFIALTARCGGNVSEMSRQSGMKRHHVRAYLRRHGIDWQASR